MLARQMAGEGPGQGSDPGDTSTEPELELRLVPNL